jgi:hypothetical protein
VKAISLYAPWCWAILFAGKDVENRDWPTRFRGRILLHASKMKSATHMEEEVEAVYSMLHESACVDKDQVLLWSFANAGKIVGAVTITGCVERSDSRWFFGRYGFLLANPVDIATPIPCRGSLGIWEVPSDIVEQVRKVRV